tara:strand:+ start:2385 stop:2918 length:534 start_codon:yes stop_codon:yes gene_type:complete
MYVEIQNKVNFNFHKIQKRVITQLISSRLNKIANTALAKVRKTFFSEKDINGKSFAKLTERYKQVYKQNKNNKIMDDTGELKSSFKKTRVSENLSIAIGSPLGRYENHLKDHIPGIERENGVFKGFKGQFGLVPQRKFFYTSDEEAYEILKDKIDKEIDSLLDDFLKNLSTRMRKLS